MDHTVTIRITDTNVNVLPEVDDVIAIAKRVQSECRPSDFQVVFQAAIQVFLQSRAGKASAFPVHSPK